MRKLKLVPTTKMERRFQVFGKNNDTIKKKIYIYIIFTLYVYLFFIFLKFFIPCRYDTNRRLWRVMYMENDKRKTRGFSPRIYGFNAARDLAVQLKYEMNKKNKK